MSHNDLHVTPVGDLREHTERRDCWCEPELQWPCLECGEPLSPHAPVIASGVEWDATDCPVCAGRGYVTKDNGTACMVIHDAKDGRE